MERKRGREARRRHANGFARIFWAGADDWSEIGDDDGDARQNVTGYSDGDDELKTTTTTTRMRMMMMMRGKVSRACDSDGERNEDGVDDE